MFHNFWKKINSIPVSWVLFFPGNEGEFEAVNSKHGPDSIISWTGGNVWPLVYQIPVSVLQVFDLILSITHAFELGSKNN